MVNGEGQTVSSTIFISKPLNQYSLTFVTISSLFSRDVIISFQRTIFWKTGRLTAIVNCNLKLMPNLVLTSFYKFSLEVKIVFPFII